jgi:DNA-binding transcriptional LysR family regulator
MFDWNDLKYFLEVARNGSTLAAARSLRLSQSTVHRRIDELERQLGEQLVTRHPKGYRLTELGEKLQTYAERIEQAAIDFERQVAALSKDVRGAVKVTCPEEVGSRLLASGIIDMFNERYPALRVEFLLSDQNLDLSKGQADIAIRAVRPIDDALIGRKIADSSWAVYASKSYVKRHGAVRQAKDIDHHAIVLFDGRMHDHHSARWLRSIAPNARIAARASNMLAMQLAVRSGAGLAPMPVLVGENDKALVRVFGPVQDIATPFFLLMHRDMKRTPRVRAFFDFVVDELPRIRPLLSAQAYARKGRTPRNPKK